MCCNVLAHNLTGRVEADGSTRTSYTPTLQSSSFPSPLGLLSFAICKLSNGDQTQIELDSNSSNVFQGAISVQDSVAFSGYTEIDMTCRVNVTGNAHNAVLTVIAIDQLN